MLEIFNILNIFLFLAFLLFILNKPNLVTYLILSEFVWIVIYLINTILAVQYDVVYLMFTAFLVLILSGLEFGLGMLLFYFF